MNAATPTEMVSRLARFSRVADGVYRLCTVFVNCYAVDVRDPDGSTGEGSTGDGSTGWVLVDSGVPASARYVRAAVWRLYGDRPPKAIVLTHGHFDHAGNAKALSQLWNVPIYAARLEMPYLTGQSDYPPQDPTPGGAMCFLSRFLPRRAMSLGPHLRQMPNDHVPEMPGWRVVATPGHTVGHVSLFRQADRLLISGDALATTDLDSWADQINWPRKLSRPPTPFTPDWPSACNSIRRLADLAPTTVLPGHGLAINDPDLGDRLRRFADEIQPPPDSRYTDTPPAFDETGAVVSIPPAVADPLGRDLVIGALAAATVGGIVLGLRCGQSEAD